MAEIRVEQKPKRSPGWVWLLIALALVALAIWYFKNSRVDNAQTTGQALLAPPPAVAHGQATGAWLAVA